MGVALAWHSSERQRADNANETGRPIAPDRPWNAPRRGISGDQERTAHCAISSIDRKASAVLCLEQIRSSAEQDGRHKKGGTSSRGRPDLL